MDEKEHKTHAEIIEEMRFHAQQNIDAEKGSPTFGILTMEGKIANEYADRLDAAHKREVDELKKINGEIATLIDPEKMPTINSANYRDALDEIERELDLYRDDGVSVINRMTEDPPDYTCLRDSIIKIYEIVEAALAASTERGKEFSREAATAENSSAVGNCAKLREALATIRKRLVATYESEACFMRYSPNKPLVDLIDAALAAQPRNCDVGTVTDQRKRYAKMCQYNCDGCALQDDRALKGGCEFSWAQLPYEEGGAK